MKNLFVLVLSVISFNTMSAQTDFFKLLKKIDFSGTESEFVYNMHEYIEHCTKSEWDAENTECNYKFKDVTVAGHNIVDSNIRVNRQSKKLYRLNLIVNLDVKDTLCYHHLRTFLDKEFGSNPIELRDYSSILNKTDIFLTWFNDNSLITLTRFEFKNQTYSTVISLEPVTTYHVDPNKIVVEYNKYGSDIPNISYFRVDNDNNVYIKEKDKKEYKLEKVKETMSPKGNVIKLQNGNMFCYRSNEKDIVLIKKGLLIRYSVKP